MSSIKICKDPLEKLCSSCASINFDAFLPIISCPDLELPSIVRPNGDMFEQNEALWSSINHSFGLLKDVALRASTCTICRFILHLVRRYRTGMPEGVKPSEWDNVLQCSFSSSEIGYLAEFHPTHGHYHRIKLQRANIRLETVQIFESSKLRMDEVIPEADFVVHNVAQIGSSSRRGTETLPLTRLASYIGRQRPPRIDQQLVKSWVSRCDTDHGYSCRFATIRSEAPIRLIDTWRCCLNDCNTSAAMRPRESSLFRPESLLHASQTIKDAMNVVEMLGERYLWVDALCILQDDAADMAFHIQRMASIYRGAYLTIIAAAGETADAGIPGINADRPTQIAADLGDCMLFGSKPRPSPYLDGAVGGTKYSSRGWTYQEQLLSPRSLILLEEQACWNCRCANWFEEMEFESSNCKFESAAGERNTQQLGDCSLAGYGKLVTAYTARVLQKENDIYNAFAGIMNALPWKFFFGLAESAFEVQLDWSWSSYTEDCLKTRRAVDSIPSWSWMAWRGEIKMYPRRRRPNMVVCYKYEDNVLRSINTDLGPPKSSRICRIEHLQRLYPTTVLQNTHVIFWTYITRVVVRRSIGNFGRLYIPLIDHDVLPSEYTTAPAPAAGEEIGFCKRHGMPHNLYTEQDVVRDCILVGSFDAPDSISVMILSWNGPVAIREHIAYVFVDKWDKLDVERKLIVLG